MADDVPGEEEVIELRGLTWRIREAMRTCDVCERRTKHRVTTVILERGTVAGDVERCLEHDEE